MNTPEDLKKTAPAKTEPATKVRKPRSTKPKVAAPSTGTVKVDGKERYFEPAPEHIDVEEFRKVVISRRSVRKFTDKAIPQAVLNDCIDMALLAPNSSGLQPWDFYVVRSKDNKKKLVKYCFGQMAAKTAAELIVVVARTDRIAEFAARMLREWPDENIPTIVKRYYKLIPIHYASGPLNAFAFAKKAAFAVGGLLYPVPRGPFTESELKLWAAKSTALACENLMLALRAHGFDSCAMEGFDDNRVADMLKLKNGEFPIMVIGAGERAVDGVFHPQVRFDRKLFVHEV
jgi:nitroreductase